MLSWVRCERELTRESRQFRWSTVANAGMYVFHILPLVRPKRFFSIGPTYMPNPSHRSHQSNVFRNIRQRHGGFAGLARRFPEWGAVRVQGRGRWRRLLDAFTAGKNNSFGTVNVPKTMQTAAIARRRRRTAHRYDAGWKILRIRRRTCQCGAEIEGALPLRSCFVDIVRVQRKRRPRGWAIPRWKQVMKHS